jgi:hypothetical protein
MECDIFLPQAYILGLSKIGTNSIQQIICGSNSEASSKMHLNVGSTQRRQQQDIKVMPLPSPTCLTMHLGHLDRRRKQATMNLWTLLPHRWLRQRCKANLLLRQRPTHHNVTSKACKPWPNKTSSSTPISTKSWSIWRHYRGGGRRTPPPSPYVPAVPTTYQQGYGGRGHGRGRGRGGRTQQQYSLGGFPPTPGMGGVFPPIYAMPPPAGGGGNMYNLTPQRGMPAYAPQGGMKQQERHLYSNVVKLFANWNACYMCGFDIPDGHTSATCQAQRKAGHDIYFTCQNAQQYIDTGRNCSTRNRHKTQFPAM